MAFPSAWLNELFAKNEIVSVISSYVDLKPKGRKLWACCPLHGEKTPSFSVSPDKQLFYCFGCHAGGTVVQFIMDMERLTFPEAVKYLADRVGMEMPNEVNDEDLRKIREHKNRLYEANKLAARYYFDCLMDPERGKPGREYAAKRGLSSEIITRFGIGYAPEGWNNLKDYLTEKGFKLNELLDAGLLVKNENKNSIYDAYRGRMIFPILGINGQVLGFGARVLNDDKPKYINTGDTPIYNKRKNLYGLNLHKNEKLSDLIMTEGYMDVIGLYKAGVTNAVASLGTALTQQQAGLLKRYVDLVYIAYDGDAAGQNATVRGLDILKSEGLDVRVITFPDNLDPDEYVQIYGKEGFDRLKENAFTLNEFKIRAMAKEFDLNNENERERFAIQACSFVAGLQPIEQKRYYKVISEMTGYPLEALIEQGKKDGGIAYSANQTVKNYYGIRRKSDAKDDSRFVTERTLIAACARSRDAIRIVKENKAEELIRNEALKSFLKALIADEHLSITNYIGELEQKDAETVSTLLQDENALQNPERTAADCIKKLKDENEKASMEELQKRLLQPDLSKAEREELLELINRKFKSRK
ncbi:MAG: DNA primase [Clostridia bacterium]|nr:DNA primase [Clostridia bacterium]